MDLCKVWTDIVAFNDIYFPDWRKTHLLYWTNALAGEVGELCGDSKKLVGGGTHRKKPMPSKKKMMNELADVFIYTVLLAESEGVEQADFCKLVNNKMKENKRRMEDDV